ncbi:MAG: TerC family protein [Deltaproteobacteria bacterium]|nr:TerC family protein [Deltaproteobacteria bacterium]
MPPPQTEHFIGTPLLWTGFTLMVIGLLALDLFVFHKRPHEEKTREAALWSVFWVALSLAFNGAIWWYTGSHEKAMEFFTGYLLEKSLSVDNLFVFMLLFSYFKVEARLEHRVLFWGILGALVMRAAFILVGGALLDSFHWFIYVFGAFLIGTGAKLFFSGKVDVEPEKNLVFRLFRRFVKRTIQDYHGDHFFVRRGGVLYATPLVAVLLVIEATDVMFSMDSIPAVFGVTRDTFIVYTSNICAILGLRAMYFLLAGTLRRFKYLHYGLALVLIFIGVKMLISERYPIPIWASLTVVAALIGGSIGVSMLKTRGEADAEAKN